MKKIESPFVALMVAPPCSGKSTYIKYHSSPDDKIISRDQIILDLNPNLDYDTAFRLTDQKIVDRIFRESLQTAFDGSNVWVDIMHLTTKRRRSTLSYVPDNYYKIAYVFDFNTKLYLERNLIRQKDGKNIPEHLYENMIKSYQPIKYDEGFDKVINVPINFKI